MPVARPNTNPDLLGLTPAAPSPVAAGTGWAAKAPGPLLESEYAGPLTAYRDNPSPKTADAYLAAVRPVIDEAARSYAGGEAASPVVRAHAKRLALEAATRYDPAQAKLRTFLLSHLRGLHRVSAKATAAVRLPEQRQIDAQRVDRHLTDMRDELGREPSDAELAARAGIPADRVRRALTVPGVLGEGQAGGAGQVAVSTPDERAWKRWVEAVYLDQSPVDQVILQHSFGLHGRPVLSGEEVARMLNLSPGSVSQRKARLQRDLDEFESFMGRRVS
jgi:hypothetical protein